MTKIVSGKFIKKSQMKSLSSLGIIIADKNTLEETIAQDCVYWENLYNADKMLKSYLHLNDCDDIADSKLYKLILNGRELWFGTLQEINAVVKSMIKLIEIEKEDFGE